MPFCISEAFFSEVDLPSNDYVLLSSDRMNRVSHCHISLQQYGFHHTDVWKMMFDLKVPQNQFVQALMRIEYKLQQSLLSGHNDRNQMLRFITSSSENPQTLENILTKTFLIWRHMPDILRLGLGLGLINN